MKVKCAKCGEIREQGYTFKRDGWQGSYNNYTLTLCHDCGERVKEFIDNES